MRQIQVGDSVYYSQAPYARGVVSQKWNDEVVITWTFADGSSTAYRYAEIDLKRFVITSPISLEQQVADLLG